MKISMRVLDGIYGCPAVGIRARIERIGEDGWELVTTGASDLGGNIAGWSEVKFERSAHRVVLDSDVYFGELGMAVGYPEVVLTIRSREEAEDYQIQVVLAPSTYSAFYVTNG
jgi:5-hydroxyisourate hydrolase